MLSQKTHAPPPIPIPTPSTHADPGLYGVSMRRRTERGAGRVVHGFLTVNVCKIDLSITNNLKAVFAPTFRMWVEGREDEVTVVQVSKKAIPM